MLSPTFFFGCEKPYFYLSIYLHTIKQVLKSNLEMKMKIEQTRLYFEL